ncbi:serine/threonine-protein kinase [Nocardia terrae]|nr:serine/threonine-protein kinase [Nocardia terrae]
MGDRRFGPYRLENLLGNGGTGQVWRAHDTRTERTVALKLLAREFAADDVYRQRFQREARTAARLNEPHVVPIHTFGEHDGQLFIDMAYVDGSDLGKLLRTRGRLPPATAVDLVSQVAGALDEAHRRGLVHRDVKPSNIIVTPNGFAYLIDFGTVQQRGLTTITGQNLVVGTPAYMAPERFTGTAGPSSDIYSLACVLYESLTGRRPFPESDAPGQMHAHLTADPPHLTDIDPALPRELDRIVTRALAKNPNERYATAGAFAAAARTAVTLAAAAPVPPAAATKRFTAVQARVPDRVLGAEEGAPVAVAGAADPTPTVPGRVRVETARSPGFPRRFAAGVAIAAVLIGAGSGWAVWRADQHTAPQPVPSSQPPAATSSRQTTTTAPRATRPDNTGSTNPQPAPPPSTTETPQLSTTAPPSSQPSTAAPQPNATTVPTTLPFPLPGDLTPPGRQNGDQPDGNGGGPGNGRGKPTKKPH